MDGDEIFIVWNNNFHSEDEFMAAFSEESLAERFISRYDARDRASMRIERYTLDSE